MSRTPRLPLIIATAGCLAVPAVPLLGQLTVPHQQVGVGDVVAVEFLAGDGQDYQLEYATDLTDSAGWTPMETVTTGDGGMMYAFDHRSAVPGKCYRIVAPAGYTGPAGPMVRAEHCAISATYGNYGFTNSPSGRDVIVSTDPQADPTYATGDIKFNIPGVVSNGTYRLTVHWLTHTMAGTAWGFRVGSDSGTVTENGATSGQWHFFYPGQAGGESNQWYTHDLAGSTPVGFSMWVNSPVATSITVNNVDAGDFYVRVWDMSPAADNYFAIEYFELVEIP